MMRGNDRFQDRAEVYAQARPDYPPALADWLRSVAGWDASRVSTVLDVGCGTGISTRMLLAQGLARTAIGLDPSAAMLAQAEASSSSSSRSYVCGPAEEVDALLPLHSVDAIAVAQAFHWLDRTRCRRAFARVLRPAASEEEPRFRPVALWWNRRDVVSPLGVALEAVVDRHCSG